MRLTGVAAPAPPDDPRTFARAIVLASPCYRCRVLRLRPRPDRGCVERDRVAPDPRVPLPHWVGGPRGDGANFGRSEACAGPLRSCRYSVGAACAGCDARDDPDPDPR